MGNNKRNFEKMENALRVIMDAGKHAINDTKTNNKFGWHELSIGNTVYFKCYDDVNDVVTVSKGKITGIITNEYEVMNKPSEDFKVEGTHIETSVTYRISWKDAKFDIDSRFVYTDKRDACMAAIYDTVCSYFEL